MLRVLCPHVTWELRSEDRCPGVQRVLGGTQRGSSYWNLLIIWSWFMYNISNPKSVLLGHNPLVLPNSSLVCKHWGSPLNLRSLKHIFDILSFISPIMVSFLPTFQHILFHKYPCNLCFLQTCLISSHCWKCGYNRGWRQEDWLKVHLKHN